MAGHQPRLNQSRVRPSGGGASRDHSFANGENLPDWNGKFYRPKSVSPKHAPRSPAQKWTLRFLTHDKALQK
jgi:hypothetical protein